jgi:ACT domain-containing protein
MKGIITVIGKDRVGIIYNITKILTEKNVNVEDISQTIMQSYFTMMMIVNLSNMNCEFKELEDSLETLGSELGISIKIQLEDLFNAMQNI